ncbi:hypothetical protein CSW77_26315 [Shigella flexneri]|nr:hypothetical protein CSW77_26315 [Shigella flexneri]
MTRFGRGSAQLILHIEVRGVLGQPQGDDRDDGCGDDVETAVEDRPSFVLPQSALMIAEAVVTKS